jgi:hypothetical protein
MVLDQHLWRDADHLGTKQLREYLASYLYLPRLRDGTVLAATIRSALGDLANDAFAYAGAYDDARKEYQGVRLGVGGTVVVDAQSVIVRMAAAKAQLARERQAQEAASGAAPTPVTVDVGGRTTSSGPGVPPPPERGPPPRFFGRVEIDPDRAVRDFGKVVEEVLQHLTTLPRSVVTVTVELEAEAPAGISDETVRTVSENARTLRFKRQDFESG